MQQQQPDGIKFHSNKAGLPCGMLFFSILTVFLIMVKENALDEIFSWKETSLGFSWGTLLIVLLGITVAAFIIYSVIKVKIIIGEVGIYSKKIDLLIPWEEIKTVRHIVVANAQRTHSSRIMIHNARSLIVYRKEHKPICFYYTSVLSLLAVKKFAPTIKTNLLTSMLIELYHIFANCFFLFFLHLSFFSAVGLRIDSLCLLVVIWSIRSFVIPLTYKYWEKQHWNTVLTGDIREDTGMIEG